MKVLRNEMNLTEASLQTEESGNKIAFLQGKCAGYRSLCNILAENGYTDYTKLTAFSEGIVKCNEENEWYTITTDFSVLLDWNLKTLVIEEIMSEIKESFDKRIQKMKDKLFYDAEKGRDLHFVKGWYFIMSVFKNWCRVIQNAYEMVKKEESQKLPFDDKKDPFDIG